MTIGLEFAQLSNEQKENHANDRTSQTDGEDVRRI